MTVTPRLPLERSSGCVPASSCSQLGCYGVPLGGGASLLKPPGFPPLGHFSTLPLLIHVLPKFAPDLLLTQILASSLDFDTYFWSSTRLPLSHLISSPCTLATFLSPSDLQVPCYLQGYRKITGRLPSCPTP